MERSELLQLSKGAFAKWEEHLKTYERNQLTFVRKKNRPAEELVSSGRTYTKEQAVKSVERIAKYVGMGYGISLSTVRDMHLVAVPAVWAGEEALMACPGLTMIVCPDGKAMLYYKNRKVKVFETDEHIADIRQKQQDAVNALGALATDAEKTEAMQEVSKADEDLTDMFGTPTYIIEGITKADMLDPDTQAMMRENADTADFASSYWASLLQERDKNRMSVGHSARNGVPRIATKKQKTKAVQAFAEQIKKDLNGGQSVIYSTDKELNDTDAEASLEDAKQAMAEGVLSMMVERGKVTVFANGEHIVYQSDESRAREGDPSVM